MRRVLGLSLGLLALTGCFDADEDGLSNGEEKKLGSDPEKADSDGDGLNDGDEAEKYMTDPTKADSDGDGYGDGDEIAQGVSPIDADEKIYEGGWPFNPNKDDIEDPGWDGPSKKGDPFPRLAWTDQFGDTVDFYDFADQGKPIILDTSGVWCYYCNEMAKWLEGENSSVYTSSFHPDVRDMVNNGEVYWITAIDAGKSGQSDKPVAADVENWAEKYSNPNVPVLLDADQQLRGFVKLNGWPSLILIEDDMEIGLNPSNYEYVFIELEKRKQNGDL